MKKLKSMLAGLSGRFGFGLFLGVVITKIVDGQGIWEGIWLGLILAFFAFIIHGLIAKD